jgi:hypothetical protein
MGTITGYAYEIIADQSLKAGQLSDEATAPPQSAPLAAPVKSVPTQAAQAQASPALGALALGSTGLQLWRREDSLLPVQ